MARLAQEGSMDFSVREVAEKITRHIFDHDFMSEYTAIFHWVQRNIRYVRDPILVEHVQTPRATLQIRSGDCDDISVLIAALAGAVGGRSRFVAGAFKKHPDGTPKLEHVWVELHEPRSNSWVVLDPVPGRKLNQMLGKLVHTLKHPAVE
jgi:transglutaminase-like putative cysteine protease